MVSCLAYVSLAVEVSFVHLRQA